MTHYKLLARIANLSCCSGAHELALEAVVAIHKPMEQSETKICEECTRISSIRIKYPCPTIQAIEKELG
jgi:hypothetical protein